MGVSPIIMVDDITHWSEHEERAIRDQLSTVLESIFFASRLRLVAARPAAAALSRTCPADPMAQARPEVGDAQCRRASAPIELRVSPARGDRHSLKSPRWGLGPIPILEPRARTQAEMPIPLGSPMSK